MAPSAPTHCPLRVAIGTTDQRGVQGGGGTPLPATVYGRSNTSFGRPVGLGMESPPTNYWREAPLDGRGGGMEGGDLGGAMGGAEFQEGQWGGGLWTPTVTLTQALTLP